ncbi:hypothetical protein GYMLUDRAFT_60813 [Collybiopsis luxurians FD-317 M1]|uniref:Uncharacterized protein n=1 Tax=Collybiopsis luxurians FD-317 M1 TaxID=944289 RepID=A0A0D0B4L3_9AGAR|nr:hypothetical protein GYMLUDRAFT_60813 [Collybiopsis luxurians FD-317 M1]
MRFTFSTYIALILGCLLPTLCLATPIAARSDLSVGSDGVMARATESTHEWGARNVESVERRAGAVVAWITRKNKVAEAEHLDQTKILAAQQKVQWFLQTAIREGHIKITGATPVTGFQTNPPSLAPEKNGQKVMWFRFSPDGTEQFKGYISESLQMGSLYKHEGRKLTGLIGFNHNQLTQNELDAAEAMKLLAASS